MNETFVMHIMNSLQVLNEQLQRIAKKQEESVRYINSKENISLYISQYKDIILRIQEIPKYIKKVKYLIEEINNLKKQVEYLYNFCLKLYNQQRNLSEQWKIIKQNEQKRDMIFLKAQYIPNENNLKLPTIITIKRDITKVKQINIEE